MANEKLVLEIVAEIADLQKKLNDIKNSLQNIAHNIPVELDARKVEQDLSTIRERLRNFKPSIEPEFQIRKVLDKASVEASLRRLSEQLQSFTPSVNIQTKLNTAQAQQEMSKLVSSVEGLKEAMASAMRRVAVEVLAVVGSFEKIKQAISEIVNVGEKMQRVQFSLTQLYGSQEAASKAFEELLELSSQVPLGLDSLLNAAVKLKSAGIDPLDGSLKALASSIIAFGGTGQDLELAAMALQQMISKGTVSMEELRQQLGERIPNAVERMAQALGYSRDELYKFYNDITEGNINARIAVEAFLASLKQEPDMSQTFINTLPGALNALKVELQKIAIEIGRSGFFDALVRGVRSLSEELKKPEIKEALREIGQAMAGFVQSIALLIPVLSEVSKFFSGVAQLIRTVASVVIAFGVTATNTVLTLIHLPALALSKLAGDEERFKQIKENMRVWMNEIKVAWSMVGEEGGKLIQGVNAQISAQRKQAEERARQAEQERKAQEERQKQKEEQAKQEALHLRQFAERLKEFEKNIKKEDMLMKMREGQLKAHASVLKSLQQKDELAILFRLDMQLEDERFQEVKDRLLKRKQEIEELMKQAPQGPALEKLISEYEKVQNQLDQIELEHTNRRVQLVADYVARAKDKLKELLKAYQDTAREATKELEKLNKSQEEAGKRAFEQLKNIPPNLRERLANLLGVSLDFSGIQELGTAFSQTSQKYQEFMSAVRSGADLETLKRLKQEFLEARDGVISFVKSLTPAQTLDIFKALGFSEGFLPSKESLRARLMSIFGLSEEDAQRMTQRLTDIWTRAVSNVSQAFRLMPELSQFISPEQLLGAQLQKGLSDVLFEDMKRRTQEVFDALSQSIQQQIQQTQGFIQELINTLQGGAVMPIRLDLSQAEQQLRDLANRELIIPARLQIQQEGAYR